VHRSAFAKGDRVYVVYYEKPSSAGRAGSTAKKGKTAAAAASAVAAAVIFAAVNGGTECLRATGARRAAVLGGPLDRSM